MLQVKYRFLFLNPVYRQKVPICIIVSECEQMQLSSWKLPLLLFRNQVSRIGESVIHILFLINSYQILSYIRHHICRLFSGNRLRWSNHYLFLCSCAVDLHAHIMQVNWNGLGFFPLTCHWWKILAGELWKYLVLACWSTSSCVWS